MCIRRRFHQVEEEEGEPLERARSPKIQIFATCRPGVLFCPAAAERDTRAAKREANCTKNHLSRRIANPFLGAGASRAAEETASRYGATPLALEGPGGFHSDASGLGLARPRPRD